MGCRSASSFLGERPLSEPPLLHDQTAAFKCDNELVAQSLDLVY
jgi:hypothetical protein